MKEPQYLTASVPNKVGVEDPKLGLLGDSAILFLIIETESEPAEIPRWLRHSDVSASILVSFVLLRTTSRNKF